MGMQDDITWKLKVDTTEAQMQAQQQMQQQQQMMSSVAQMQAMNNVMTSMPYASQMSPMGAVARSTFSSAMNTMGGVSGILNPGMSGFYGSQMISPQQPRGNYSYPGGFIDTPLDTAYRTGGIHPFVQDMKMSIGKTIAFSGLGQSGLGKFLGLDSLGTPGAGADLDSPIFRNQQIYAETRGQEHAAFKEKFLLGAPTVAAMGTSAYLATSGAALALGGPLALGLGAVALAGGAAYEASVGQLRQGKEDYSEMARYARDASAPQTREMIGGGLNHKSLGNMATGMAKLVQKDDWLSRESYAQVEQLSFEFGFQQTETKTDKMLQVIDNVAKTIKGITAVGGKLMDVHKHMDHLAAMGINPGTESARATGYMAGMSVNAFSAGMTLNETMDKARQASGMFAQQGMSLEVGSRVHAQNMALVGETIRSGAMSYGDVQYFGGRDGLANSLTQGAEALNRNPLGQLGMMSMLRNPGMSEKIAKGGVDAEQLMNSGMTNMSPTEYLNMKYRMPQLTKNLDPNTVQMGQLSVVVNSVKKMMNLKPGEKVDPGIIMSVLEQSGVNEHDATAMLNVVEKAPQAAEGQMESVVDSTIRMQAENLRKKPSLMSNFYTGFQKMKEKAFDGFSARWASHEFDEIGEKADSTMEKIGTGSSVKLRKSMTGVQGVYDDLLDDLDREQAGKGGTNYKKEVNADINKKVLDKYKEEGLGFFSLRDVDTGAGERNNARNPFLESAIKSTDKARIDTFSGIDKMRSDVESGSFKGKATKQVTEEQITRAVANITATGKVSSEDESVINNGMIAGLVSDTNKNLLTKSKNTVSDGAILEAADYVDSTGKNREYLAQGYEGKLEGKSHEDAIDKVSKMSASERKTLLNSIGSDSNMKKLDMRIADAALGKGVVKSFAGMTAEQASKAGDFVNVLKDSVPDADQSSIDNIQKSFDDAKDFGDVSNDALKFGTLKELKVKTDEAGNALTDSLSDLTGLGRESFQTREQLNFATSTVKKAGIDKLLRDGDGLDAAISSGSIKGLVGQENTAAIDALLEKGDKDGIKKLLSSLSGTMTKDLNSRSEGNTDLKAMGLKIEKGVGKDVATRSFYRGSDSSLLTDSQRILKAGDAFSEASGRESALTGEISKEQGLKMSDTLGLIKKDSDRSLALDELDKLEKGNGDAEHFFTAVGKDGKMKGVSDAAKDLIAAKRSGATIDVDKMTEKFRGEFSALNGGKRMSGAEGAAFDKTIKKLTEKNTSENAVVKSVTGLIDKTVVPNVGTAISDKGSGLLDPEQIKSLQAAVEQSVRSSDLAASIGSQLKSLPTSLESSTKELKAAFGTSKDSDSYTGAVSSNTSALQALTSAIQGKPGAVIPDYNKKVEKPK